MAQTNNDLLIRIMKRSGKCRWCKKPLKESRWQTIEETRYCGATCAVRGERRKQNKALARAKQVSNTRAASQVRYCQVCDIRISPDRLRRWHNVRTCGTCSLELRAAQKRGAITRYRRRLRRRLAQGRADALVDVANCVVCRSAIAAERRARWPHVVTCSAGCAAEHQKELVRDGKRRRRRRLKTEVPATDPT